jgi:hypothetical protein
MLFRNVVAASLALGVSIAAVRDARACQCAEPPPPAVAAARADAVFTATVSSIENGSLTTGNGSTLPTHVVHMHVDLAWRAMEAGDDIAVVTSNTDAACGYPFAVGRAYLVYAVRSDGAWVASLCSRTRPLDDANEDLAALGSPTSSGSPAPVQRNVTIVHDQPTRPSHGGCASCAVGCSPRWHGVALLWLALAAIGRRRRT